MSSQLMSEGKTKELLFLTGTNLKLLRGETTGSLSDRFCCSTGSTLEETCRLAVGYQNIVPVRSSGGRLALLDLTAPFLFRGRRRFYGSESLRVLFSVLVSLGFQSGRELILHPDWALCFSSVVKQNFSVKGPESCFPEDSPGSVGSAPPVIS